LEHARPRAACLPTRVATVIGTTRAGLSRASGVAALGLAIGLEKLTDGRRHAVTRVELEYRHLAGRDGDDPAAVALQPVPDFAQLGEPHRIDAAHPRRTFRCRASLRAVL